MAITLRGLVSCYPKFVSLYVLFNVHLSHTDQNGGEEGKNGVIVKGVFLLYQLGVLLSSSVECCMHVYICMCVFGYM